MGSRVRHLFCFFYVFLRHRFSSLTIWQYVNVWSPLPESLVQVKSSQENDTGVSQFLLTQIHTVKLLVYFVSKGMKLKETEIIPIKTMATSEPYLLTIIKPSIMMPFCIFD